MERISVHSFNYPIISLHYACVCVQVLDRGAMVCSHHYYYDDDNGGLLPAYVCI